MIVLLIAAISMIPVGSNANVHFGTETKDLEVESHLQRLTLEQKVGQLFIFGFQGQSLKEQLEKTIPQLQPGAVIVFKRNIATPVQIAQLNHRAQAASLKASGLPLFVMIDQEGGNVTRIKSIPNPPSALAMGKTNSKEIVEEAGFITGTMLSQLGFNINLAPVVDLSNPNTKNFIGTRSFGDDPEVVSIMAEAYARGIQKADVLPTLKHFPGHGGEVADSHKDLPKKSTSLEEMLVRDLKPFEHLSLSGVDSAVMVAHISYPKIEPSGLPATFSSQLVTQILKKDLGYRGLIMTDDIEMAGADKVGTIGERAIKAVEAGNDMIMVAWSHKRQTSAYNAVLGAAKSGRLTVARIDDSLRKIIRLKMDSEVIMRHNLPTTLEIKVAMDNYLRSIRAFAKKVTTANMQVELRQMPNLKNTLPSVKNVFVFSADNLFFQEFKKYSSVPTYFYPLSPKKPNPTTMRMNRNRTALGIYYATGTISAAQLNKLDKSIKGRLIVVNSSNPGVILNQQDYLAVIDIFSPNFESGKWLAQFLEQGIEPVIEMREPAAGAAFRAPAKLKNPSDS